MLRIAINGYGRIGRCLVRALFERKLEQQIHLTAINDLGEQSTLAHLTRFDSTFGRFPGDISLDGDTLRVNGHPIQLLREREVTNLPWREHAVDLVLECTGKLKKREQVEQHISAGSPRVLLSHPLDSADLTVVYGVNHQLLGDQQIVSNASCTTNCLAPLAKVLHEKIGMVHGLMTTIHAYTNDQVLTDVFHKDLRRARSATQSQIPTKTGAAAAVGLVLPELNGKLTGFSMRVPTINVSVVDLSFVAARETSKEEIDAVVKAASEGPLKGILGFNTKPLVSIDFNHDPHSSVYDSTLTQVMGGTLVKVCSWYDNEWGFSNRMLDTTLALMAAK